MIAFVAPGQGSEVPGMGLDLVDAYAPAREAIESASRTIDRDLRGALAGRDRAILTTSVAQPALTAVALATAAVLESRGLRAELAFGYSAGEIAATAIAGTLSRAGAMRVSAGRGQLMQSAATAIPGGMASLPIEDATQLRAIRSVGEAHGLFAIANDITHGQALVSGDEAAIRAVLGRFAGHRALVSGAWHSEAMRPALAPFRALLDKVPMIPPSIPLALADAGATVDSVDAIRDALAMQLVRAMRTQATIEAVLGAGVTEIVILGPSRHLRGLFRERIGDRARIHSTDTVRDVERTLELLA